MPQESVYSCQYCGYVFAEHEKKFARALRNRLKDIFPTFKKETIAPSKRTSTLKDKGGTRSEKTGVNTDLELIIRKTDRAGIVEKGLTADAK